MEAKYSKTASTRSSLHFCRFRPIRQETPYKHHNTGDVLRATYKILHTRKLKYEISERHNRDEHDEAVTWAMACGSTLLINCPEMERSRRKVHCREACVWTYTRCKTIREVKCWKTLTGCPEPDRSARSQPSASSASYLHSVSTEHNKTRVFAL